MEGTNLRFQAADFEVVPKTHVTERCLILIRYVHAYKQKKTINKPDKKIDNTIPD